MSTPEYSWGDNASLEGTGVAFEAAASDQELAVLRALAGSLEALGPSNIERLCPKVGGAGEVLKRLAMKGLVERMARGSYRLTDWLFAEYVRRCNTTP